MNEYFRIEARICEIRTKLREATEENMTAKQWEDLEAEMDDLKLQLYSFQGIREPSHPNSAAEIQKSVTYG